ncbi:hypothetical protein IEQ34_002780 [Dendrobium chrysotoxum]|uniref:Uncharacterized protein n=1 Tax=Dendrobium chrysotoxum TaxID=161865 RepID=A0AAV7HIW8_DENCH|nr:hypothetical protein IEQ34_002780 [Dendrobium chrysotoxum]
MSVLCRTRISVIEENIVKYSIHTNNIHHHPRILRPRLTDPSCSLNSSPCPFCLGEVNSPIHHLCTIDLQLTRVINAHEPPVFHKMDIPFNSLSLFLTAFSTSNWPSKLLHPSMLDLSASTAE